MVRFILIVISGLAGVHYLREGEEVTSKLTSVSVLVSFRSGEKVPGSLTEKCYFVKYFMNALSLFYYCSLESFCIVAV